MKTLLFLYFIFQGLAIAAEIVKSFDLNQDGKNDYFQYIDGERVKRTTEDRDYDGRIDFITDFSNADLRKMTFQDTNGDGLFDLKKTYSNFKSKYIRVKTEMDRDGDGKYEIHFFSTYKRVQEEQSAQCMEIFVEAKIEAFSDSSLNALYAATDGYIRTDFGIRVDNQCLLNFGVDFISLAKSSLEKGMKCLLDLHEKSGKKNSTGALRNAFLIGQQLSEEITTVSCSEKGGYDWKDTRAHASTDQSDSISSLGVKHPLISINPSLPYKRPIETDEKEAIARTLFHEKFHNIGYLHDDDIEYGYTCGDCCLSTDAPSITCSICLGDYKNIQDKKYIEDLAFYYRDNFFSEKLLDVLTNFAKSEAGDIKMMKFYANAASTYFNPLGGSIKKILNDKGINVDGISFQVSEDLAKDLEMMEISDIVAKSLIQLYGQKNGADAVETLAVNQEKIAKYIKTEKKDGFKFAQQYLIEQLKRVLDEMWLNEFPSKGQTEVSNEHGAYLLMEKFSFLEDS